MSGLCVGRGALYGDEIAGKRGLDAGVLFELMEGPVEFGLEMLQQGCGAAAFFMNESDADGMRRGMAGKITVQPQGQGLALETEAFFPFELRPAGGAEKV